MTWQWHTYIFSRKPMTVPWSDLAHSHVYFPSIFASVGKRRIKPITEEKKHKRKIMEMTRNWTYRVLCSLTSMFACERSARSSWLQDRLAPVNLNNYQLKEVEKYLRSKYINQTYRKTSHTTWTLNIKIRKELYAFLTHTITLKFM